MRPVDDATVGAVARKGGAQGEPVEGVIERLAEGELRALLLKAAADHGDVARAVRLAGAAPAERVLALRSAVDDLRTRRFLGYRESMEWANDADVVVDEIARAAEASPSRELLALVELAVGRVAKLIEHADDSSGSIGDVAHALLTVHERLCDAGVADPVALAKWMIKFGIDDQDFFNLDPVRYADALGEPGVTLLRRVVAERSAAPRVPFAVGYTEVRLAVLDRDVDRLVELLGEDLTAPHQFIRVAEVMLELGRGDDALAWARRGFAETTGWQVAKLYEIACGVLTERGDATSVLDLRREQHGRMPSSSTYAWLQSAARAVAAWPGERGRAREILRARDTGGFVDALMSDGDVDEAWDVTMAADPEVIGWRRLAQLAEAREPADPAGAMGVYLRLVESTLQTADRKAYSIAAKHLKAARRSAAAAGLAEEFADYLTALREQHRRRPTLIQILDKSGLK